MKICWGEGVHHVGYEGRDVLVVFGRRKEGEVSGWVISIRTHLERVQAIGVKKVLSRRKTAALVSLKCL